VREKALLGELVCESLLNPRAIPLHIPVQQTRASAAMLGDIDDPNQIPSFSVTENDGQDLPGESCSSDDEGSETNGDCGGLGTHLEAKEGVSTQSDLSTNPDVDPKSNAGVVDEKLASVVPNQMQDSDADLSKGGHQNKANASKESSCTEEQEIEKQSKILAKSTAGEQATEKESKTLVKRQLQSPEEEKEESKAAGATDDVSEDKNTMWQQKDKEEKSRTKADDEDSNGLGFLPMIVDSDPDDDDEES